MAQTGFQCKLSVAGSDFADLVKIVLPAVEAGEQEVTGLNQVDGSSKADPVRRFLPTLIDQGLIKAEGFYTKAGYVTLHGLVAKKDKTFVITAPPSTEGGSDTLAATFTGFVKKVDEVEFDKENPTMVKFEIRVSKAATLA